MTAKATVPFSRHARSSITLAAWLIPALLQLVFTPHMCAQSAASVDFSAQILPILSAHCVRCHGPKVQKGGLRLDSKSLVIRGGDSGKSVLPEQPGSSPLLIRLTTEDAEQRMPLGKPALSHDQIDLVRRWIKAGAPGNDSGKIARNGSDHWAFQPVKNPRPVIIEPNSWVRNPIDAFVLSRLRKEGIAPAPEADRHTLLRRLFLDLVGLPPTPRQVADFVADQRPDAYERVVDLLLASPHFGEQFGNHWLDLARYGDSDGFEQDGQRPSAYRWRDWVIQAINSDMPFDRFTIEQLAGDLLPKATPAQLLATGFHRNTPTNREGGIDKEEARLQAIVERVGTTGTVWLGLTVGCAECHAHKFDPLSQAEFYQLYAFFNDQVDEADLPLPPTEADLLQYEQAKVAFEKRLQSLREQIAKSGPEEREALERTLTRIQRRPPSPPKPSLAVFRPAAAARHTHVHKGGNFRQAGQEVRPGTPAALPPLVARAGGNQSADRLDLARWLVDPANPLTARVEANRIWQYLFGKGIVATPEDFGVMGDPPTHPELLDYLASYLRSHGWSRKSLVRHIATSSTYRQASLSRPELAKVDPNNNLLARQNRFRLSAEVVRDVYLATAGLLNQSVGGPGMRPETPPGFKEFAYRFTWNTDAAPECHRRGMYIFFQRNMVFPLLRTFDRSDSNVTCVRRERSNTPLQALTQLNDPELIGAASALARRVLHEAPPTQKGRIDHVVRLCYGRPASDRENRFLAQLWAELHDHYDQQTESVAGLAELRHNLAASPAELAAWIAVARVLMNTDQFITRE